MAMRAVLHYRAREGRNTYRMVDLTFCGEEECSSIGSLRRKRLERLIAEAERQNVHLSYQDMSLILSTSPSTIKRDLKLLRRG